MKQLTIVRHAKSSWNYQVSDKDRPLLERGINDALLVAQSIKDFIQPDAVFSSPAIRALHTCMIFMRSLHIKDSKLCITEKLYDFNASLNIYVCCPNVKKVFFNKECYHKA